MPENIPANRLRELVDLIEKKEDDLDKFAV